MVEVLQANKTLKALVLNMTTKHSQEDVSSLFDMVSRINAFSRLLLHWVYPRASDFPKSALMASTPSVSMILDDYEAEDAAGALDTIASSCNLDMATIQCSANVKKAVIQRLADTLASTKSLQQVPLIFYAPCTAVHAYSILQGLQTVIPPQKNISRTTCSPFVPDIEGRLMESKHCNIIFPTPE
ncbi:uncharacterized protein LOC119372200 isoform X2 [Rhipicephalus sanguineus]|uniref:uncharacterized protein LOC119372200 isoform X2 n=1 Tax=Rhipicephalus sanguineus TaxID=34632 RepID=UPI0020C324F6|nr:uncharacterized protein LOC119372200 isoform X2 [Rhipicephalus sanguineus]